MLIEDVLTKAGLSDKEAAVYLAALELGPSSAQAISRKARVARATTYLVLEALIEQGLVKREVAGKRTVFAPEPPDELLRLLERRERSLREQREGVVRLLPELQALMKKVDGGPRVRYYAGREGLEAMRREMVMRATPSDVWLNLSPADHLCAVFGRSAASCQSRIAKGIRSKTIFTTTSPVLKKSLLARSQADLMERRFAAPADFSSASGMTVSGDQVAIGSFQGTVGGAIVDSQSVAAMMREFFELSWRHVDKSSE